MQINLSGKKALISGGSRGIGLAIAKMFVEAGADVSICARSSAALDTAIKSLKTDGRKVIATQCDLSKPEEIKAWVTQSGQELGGIDILVNNASGFGQTDDEKGWELSVNVDLMASVRACHAALPYIEKQGGSIVHISSISGMRASTRTPPYGAVKAALIEYAQTQAKALAPKKIRVNCIAPGSIDFEGGTWGNAKTKNPQLYQKTLESIPSGRFGTPDEIAKVALFLVSDLASWVTGQTIAVDGGQIL